MRFQLGNLPQSLLVIISIIANCMSPVVSVGHARVDRDHAACFMTGHQCKSSCDLSSATIPEPQKHCCPTQLESPPQHPAPPKDEGTPCDGQCGCHCWLVVCTCTSALATFNPSEAGLPNLSSKFSRAMIESFIPFLWVDSLLRPPQF